jgi:phosphoserine phosphatase
MIHAADTHDAAFFDLDGTLLPDPSLEWRFFSSLRFHNEIPFVNYLRWTAEALRLLPNGLVAVQHSNKRYLTNIWCDLVYRYTESISFFEQGIARVLWHVRQGHRIFLVSGTLEPLAQLAACALECELEICGAQFDRCICATQLIQVGGRWTGQLARNALYGPAKAHAITELANQENLDLRHCHAYANALLDRPFLCSVGHPHVVNPGRELAAVANANDWPIWHWHRQKQVSANENSFLREQIHPTEGPA